jgi:hypothetical protein
MAAEIIPIRPRDVLTDAECNEMKAALRIVMQVLCGDEGRRAVITTQRNEDGTGYVSAVIETEQAPMAWTLCREQGRYVLIGADWETVATGGTLEDVLAAVR